MGLGDQLTTVDFVRGLNEIDKIRGEYFEYTICFPEDLTERGEDYCDFSKQLFDKTYANNPNVNINWKTNHSGRQWGAGRTNLSDLCYTVFETRSGLQNLVERRCSWEECFNFIKFKPFPKLICNKHSYKSDDTYAVVTTRLRATTSLKTPFEFATHMFDYVEPMLNILSEKYDKIFIVGENKINLWGYDTSKHGTGAFKTDPPFPNLYRSICEAVERNPKIKEKIIDATSSTFNMDTFLDENSLCRDADKVVCFGHGGNYARQLYIGSNLSCLMTGPGSGWDHPFVERLIKCKKFPHIFDPPITHLDNLQLFHEDDIEKFYESL